MPEADNLYNEIVQALESVRANARCSDVTKMLESLGFEVRDGKRGGHKIFVHTALPAFTSASFNCGHGKNPEIKRSYIRNILRVLGEHESDLRKYLRQDDSNG